MGQLLLVGYMVLMPTFFERIFHQTALQAALLITPSTFMIFVSSPLAGKLMKRIPPYYLLALGFVLISSGYLGLSFVNADFNYIFYLICSILIGAGYGMIVGPLSVLSSSDFSGSRLTTSQSVIGVLRQLGTVLATTLFISGLTYNLSFAKGSTDYLSSFTSLYLYTAPVAFVLALLFLLLPVRLKNIREYIDMRSDDVVLGILSESSSTGYEIKQKFETVFSNFYNASFGSIYPILHKLEQQGKIAVTLIHQDGKPDKKIYTITKKGMESFYHYLQTEIEPRKNKWDFMVRVYFADKIPLPKQKEMIDTELAKQEDSVNQLLALQKMIKGSATQFQKFSLDVGIKQKEVFIKELKQLRARLD